MKSYAEYQETDLDWLPRVPRHWTMPYFQHVAKENRIKNIGLKETRVLSLSYGKIIVRDMTKSSLLPASFETYQIIKPGNIIFRLTDLQNDHRSLRTGLVQHDGIITSAYLCVSTSSNLLPAFFAQFLRVYDLRKMFYGYGGGVRQSIGYEDLRKMRVPLPSLVEQKRIVSYLAAKNREIENYIAAKRALLLRLRELSAAVISHAVTRGLNPDVKTKPSGVEWLGDVPRHWEVKPLFRVAYERSEKNIGMQESLVLSLSYGNIKRKDMEKNNGLIPASFETYQIVYPGDVVMRLTDLQNDHKSLRTGIVYEKGIITSAYLCLAFDQRKNNFESEFVGYLLHAFDLTKIYYSLGGGVRQSIGYAEVKRLPITLPPLEEQRAIVAFIKSQLAMIREAQGRIEREIKLAGELWTTLVAEVVTGQVDVSDWNGAEKMAELSEEFLEIEDEITEEEADFIED